MDIKRKVIALIDWASSLNIFMVIVAGLLLRLIWALLVPVIPVSDSIAYDIFAFNIWQHGTFGWEPNEPSSFWPVGTSAIYAFLYSLFGHSYSAVVAFNIVASLGIIYFSYRVTSQFFSTREGTLVALLVAICPTLILFTTILASELPYLLMILMGIHFFFMQQKTILLNILFAGFCFAVAYYIRPLAVTVILISAFCAVAFLRQQVFPNVLKCAGVLILVFLAALPWMKRNYDLYGEYASMSTNGGVVFWMGNSPGTSGGYNTVPDYVGNLNDFERDQVLKAEAMAYIKEDPVAFVTRTLWKFYLFHSYETIGVTWNEPGITSRFGERMVIPLKILTTLFWFSILAGGVVGMALFLLKKGFFSLIFHPFTILWLSTAGLHAIIAAQDRYHMPVYPFVMGFFAFLLVCILNSGPADQQGQPVHHPN